MIYKKITPEIEKIWEQWHKKFALPENGINPYTGLPTTDKTLLLSDEELQHILNLDKRCLELIHELNQDIKTIYEDIKMRTSLGSHVYDGANIIGEIVWEADYKNHRLQHLIDVNISDEVYVVNPAKEDSIKRIDEMDSLLYGNWEGHFKDLYDEQQKKGIQLTRTFRVLFDESCIFTPEDLMAVSPDEIYKHIEILI